MQGQRFTMEPDPIGKTASQLLQYDNKSSLAKKIFSEQIRLLYEQIPFAITTQFSLSIILSIALWQVVFHPLIIIWEIAMLLICIGWLTMTYYYHRNKTLHKQNTWLFLTALFTFLAGCEWGLAGSVLIPINHLPVQTFVAIVLFGITAASILFFSASLQVFALFLFPCLLPFSLWLFAGEKLYYLLGLCTVIYMAGIFVSAYFINKFIKSALSLYYQNIILDSLMEERLNYQASHDLLTGLPNRTLLYDRIQQSIAYAKRYNTRLYLLFLDIDNFKLINDNLGHHIGDVLLKTIANRLKSDIRESDTVSRFDGDEFAILFVTNKYSNVLQLSQKILATIAEPIQLKKQEIVVTSSVGACIYPKDGRDATTLLQHAELAMYIAKNQGGNNFKIYNNSMKKQSEKNLAMQIELRKGLANNQFFLLYQPTINLQSGKIIGVEALVRWRHPKQGILHPLQFIPIAEESKIIILLGAWVFRNACLQNKAWQDKGLPPIHMAINVSGIQLGRANFFELVTQALEESQLEPRYVEIELTESIIMNDKHQNLQTLKRLKEIGVNLTIDDFGTGYSCLNYLKEFPVNKLKIDQSFVRHCISDTNDASLVEAIIAMGHGLKLKVLAEGIETDEQLQFLIQCQCDEGQGFFYGEPMNAESFAQILAQSNS